MKDRRRGGRSPSGMERYGTQMGMLAERQLHDAAMQASHQELLLANQSLKAEMEHRLQAMADLEHMANHDALTGLPNRVLFNDRLQHMIEGARRTDQNVAVMFLDLDHFKDVNDTLGHAAGDMLLKEVSNRLKKCIRTNDMVARLGGDEFAVIQMALNYPVDAHIQAKRIIKSLGEPVSLKQNKVFIGCSIGITVFPDDAQSVGQLQKNADMAMYQSKEESRNTFRFFNANLNTVLNRRTFLEHELRDAISDNQLEIYFQPKIDLRRNRIAGAEALVRWPHPEEGMISPEEFVPVAEKSGMISPIGEWMLRKACEHISQWEREGLPPLTIAVNLSAIQFKEKDIPVLLKEILQETQINHARLELEVTETAIMQDMRDAIKVLHDIHQLGVHLSIDDFGTGYSSLSYLRQLPVNKIKIDRSFISEIETEDAAATITKAVIALGKSLALEVVAEGVETIEQLSFLIDHECDEAQGYFFARALPAEEYVEFVKGWKGLPGSS